MGRSVVWLALLAGAVAGAAATRDSVDEFDEFAEMDADPQQPDPEVRSGGRLVDCPSVHLTTVTPS